MVTHCIHDKRALAWYGVVIDPTLSTHLQRRRELLPLLVSLDIPEATVNWSLDGRRDTRQSFSAGGLHAAHGLKLPMQLIIAAEQLAAADGPICFCHIAPTVISAKVVFPFTLN